MCSEEGTIGGLQAWAERFLVAHGGGDKFYEAILAWLPLAHHHLLVKPERDPDWKRMARPRKIPTVGALCVYFIEYTCDV